MRIPKAFDSQTALAYFDSAMTRYWYRPFTYSGAAPFASGSEGVE